MDGQQIVPFCPPSQDLKWNSPKESVIHLKFESRTPALPLQSTNCAWYRLVLSYDQLNSVPIHPVHSFLRSADCLHSSGLLGNFATYQMSASDWLLMMTNNSHSPIINLPSNYQKFHSVSPHYKVFLNSVFV